MKNNCEKVNSRNDKNDKSKTSAQRYKELLRDISCKACANINNKYKQKHLFSVQYFPEGGRNEINEVLGRLYFVLEEVTDLEGKTFRVSKMNADPVDNVLHFFVHYDFFTHKVEILGDPMESIEIQNTARS